MDKELCTCIYETENGTDKLKAGITIKDGGNNNHWFIVLFLYYI